MLVDTGASENTLYVSKKIYESVNSYEKVEVYTQNDTVILKRIETDIVIFKHKYKLKFLLNPNLNMNEFVKTYKLKYPILGVLSSKFCQENNLVINYKLRKIYKYE